VPVRVLAFSRWSSRARRLSRRPSASVCLRPARPTKDLPDPDGLPPLAEWGPNVDRPWFRSGPSRRPLEAWLDACPLRRARLADRARCAEQ